MRVRDIIIYGVAFVLLVLNIFWQEEMVTLVGHYPFITFLELAVSGFVLYIVFFKKKGSDGKN